MRFTWIMMAAALGLLSGFGLGFWARTVMLMRRSRLVSAREKTRRQDAEREAKGIVREGEIQARSAVIKAREAFEASVKEQRREINETMSNLNARERAISQREDNLDRKAEVLDRKQEVIDRKTADAEAMQTAAKALSEEAGRARAQAEAKLQKLGGICSNRRRRISARTWAVFSSARRSASRRLPPRRRSRFSSAPWSAMPGAMWRST